MMVISFNTLVAYGTVPGPSGPDYLAFRAKISGIDITKKLHKGEIINWFKGSRVLARG